ncbi:hypothetical protein EDB83DRAFT_761239 [Lactarius deliciosus]|nr:hypothetical protein EDB83DRAFT_761239 [Lactarius deliciosus]
MPIASCSRPLSHSSLRFRSLATAPSSSTTLAFATPSASSSARTRVSALSARALIARSASSAFLRCCCCCSSCGTAGVEAAARSRAPACASRTSVARPCSSSRMYAASCARSRSSSASCCAVSSTLLYVAEAGAVVALVPVPGARCLRRARSAAGSDDGAASLSSTFACIASDQGENYLFMIGRDALCWRLYLSCPLQVLYEMVYEKVEVAGLSILYHRGWQGKGKGKGFVRAEDTRRSVHHHQRYLYQLALRLTTRYTHSIRPQTIRKFDKDIQQA